MCGYEACDHDVVGGKDRGDHAGFSGWAAVLGNGTKRSGFRIERSLRQREKVSLHGLLIQCGASKEFR